MARPVKSTDPTVRAVLKYARELRERAARQRVGDPYAQPYEITDAAARKVSQQLGPPAALREIARRARAHELRLAEEDARASQAHTELLAHQLTMAGEREALAESLSLGARLDAALLAIGMFSETSAQRLDGDRITGSRTSDRVWMGRRRMERDMLLMDVESLVTRLEKHVQSTRRRMIETGIAA